jgi:hypothetical protein
MRMTEEQAEELGRFLADHPMPLAWGERLGPELLDLTDDQRLVMALPPLLLGRIAERARQQGLPRPLPADVLDRLKPTEHKVAGWRSVYRDDKEWVRAMMFADLADMGEEDDDFLVWFDMDSGMAGQLFEQIKEQFKDQKQARPSWDEKGWRHMIAPQWAGAVSFAPVWDHSHDLALRIGPSDWVPPRVMMAYGLVQTMERAHVLRIDPEQMAVLPEWESSQDVFDYAAEVTLPFDPLYLDFDRPGGIAPSVGRWDTASELLLSGACVFNRNGVLTVAPIGWPSKPTKMEDKRYLWNKYESPGWMLFGKRAKNQQGEPVNSGPIVIQPDFSEIKGEACVISADLILDEEKDWPGYAVIPLSREGLHESMAEEGYSNEQVVDYLGDWGDMLWKLATKVLAALSITEAMEVEYVDAPMERRDYKRAVKRGWPITQQVVLRSHSTRYRERNEPSGNEANYSHRFWRRANVAHYPIGTRMADARPDLVTPCKRQAASSCGFCRKVKRPATIVGPKDAAGAEEPDPAARHEEGRVSTMCAPTMNANGGELLWRRSSR